jgi:hypothetical protein
VHTPIRYSGENINPLLRIRLYKRRHETVATSPEFIDIPWDGQFVEELEHQIALHTQGQYEVCPLP